MADDAAVVRALLARAVSAAGHEVVAEAEDASTAVAVARTLAPHVVILDGRLPGAPAAEIVAQIREASPATVTFVLVSLAERDVLDAALAVGARSGLIRPLRPADISEAFARISNAVT